MLENNDLVEKEDENKVNDDNYVTEEKETKTFQQIVDILKSQKNPDLE